jgi:hypothetical protein
MAPPKINRTDGSELPQKPPPELETKAEKSAYKYLLTLCKKIIYAEGCDIATLVLASQRKAEVDRLHADRREVVAAGNQFVEGGNGQIRMHPVFAELRAAEQAYHQSLRSLYLTPNSRGNARGGSGEIAPSTPPAKSAEERAAEDDLR